MSLSHSHTLDDWNKKINTYDSEIKLDKGSSHQGRTNVDGSGNSIVDEDEDESNDKDVGWVLSRELMDMSKLDRNAIMEEIHGVRCLAIQETPELIRKALHEFQSELDKEIANTANSKNPSSKSFAYHLLMKQYQQHKTKRDRGQRDSPPGANVNSIASRTKNSGHPSYSYAIDDDNFRLRFLRCERFDVVKAVRRFYNYLDYAYEYWGEVALKRPIRLTDFTKAEIKLFRKGFFQILPFRDSSGRRVMVFLGGMDPHQDIRARNKICFYIWDVVTRDSVESQQKGFVIIRLHGNVSTEDAAVSSESSDSNEKINSRSGSNNTNFRSVVTNLNRSLSSIPSRIVAVHTRIPNHPGFRLVWKLFMTQVLTGENVSLRPRFVACLTDSDIETRYQLKSYGIPTQLLPMTDTDTIKCTYHNQWMKTRKLLEEQEYRFTSEDDSIVPSGVASVVAPSDDEELVECPALNDVVFRKGSRVTSIENPGNRFFRDLIRTFLEEKERVSEQLKQEESESVETYDDALPLDIGRIGISIPPQSSSHSKKGNAITSPAPTLSAETSTGLASSLGQKKTTGKAFCDWLVDYIEEERKGRFLEWDADVNGWVVMRDKIQISRKASITLYNWGKRLNAETAASKKGKRQQRSGPSPASDVGDTVIETNNDHNHKNRIDVEGSGDAKYSAYRFIDGQRPPFEQQKLCGISSTHPCWNVHRTPNSGMKRPRTDDSFSSVSWNIPFSWDSTSHS